MYTVLVIHGGDAVAELKLLLAVPDGGRRRKRHPRRRRCGRIEADSPRMGHEDPHRHVIHGGDAVAELKLPGPSWAASTRRAGVIHGGDAVAELKLRPRPNNPELSGVIHGGDAVAELKPQVADPHDATPPSSTAATLWPN